MKKKYTIPKILGKLFKDSFKNIRIHFVAYMMFGVIGRALCRFDNAYQ